MVNRISFRVTCQRYFGNIRNARWCAVLLYVLPGYERADVQRMFTPNTATYSRRWLGNKPADGVAVKRNTDEFGIANHGDGRNMFVL